MKNAISLVCAGAFLALCFSPVADAAKQAPPFGQSLEWNTGSESPSLDALAGKSVIVMFYQSWCPICNGWSGDLFKQLTDTYGDDPRVVLVAIKTDGGKMNDALAYLSKSSDTSKWLVAVDEGGVYQQQALGRDKLYQYMWVKPNGEIGEEGGSGSYTTGTNPKKFSLAEPNEAKKFRNGTATLMPAGKELDGALDSAVSLAEKGLLLSALGEAAKLSSSADKEDVAAFRQAIAGKVEKSVESHKVVIEDESSENRYLSLLSLEGIVKNFGSSAPGKAAQELVAIHGRSSWVATEKEAADDYESIMRRATRADDQRSRERISKALLKLSEEFPNTVYGRIAASAVKEK
jgi:hypothetical protein